MSIPLKPKSLANPLPATLVQILGSDEVVLLELQGSLATQGEPAGELVGVLSLSNESKPTLQIGHHHLEGSVQSLPRPLAVIVKSKTNTPGPLIRRGSNTDASTDTTLNIARNDPNLMQMQLDDDSARIDTGNNALISAEDRAAATTSGIGPPISYEIITLVRKKLVFSKRPVPIVPAGAKARTASVRVAISGSGAVDAMDES